MLNVLHEIEKALPSLLSEEGAWQSVYVDYHPPFVERVWRQVGQNRVYLHRIHPCKKSEALFHPHPWPSAMRIVEGEYEMSVGYGKGDEAPPVAATIIMASGSSYEMVDPDGWHYVRPLGKPTLSLMVTGAPWERTAPKSTRPLQPLPLDRIAELMKLFASHYNAQSGANSGA